MDYKKIGVDLGFSQSKFSTLSRETCFKSVVGWNFRSMMSDFGQDDIVFDQPDMIIGRGAITYADDEIRHEDDHWIESDEFKMLFLAGVSELYEGNGNIYAVCTLPINLYKTSKGKVTENLEGTHMFTRFKREPQKISVKIREVPQAFATLCNEVLDDSGIPTSSLALKRIGVIDIGGKTTNFLLTERLRDIKHRSASLNKGCWHIVKQLQQVLMRELNRSTLSEYEVEEALFSSILEHNGKEQNIDEYRDPILQSFLRQLLPKIQQIWPDFQGIHKIFLAGGGSYLFEAELCQRFQQAGLVSDPIHGNAKGAAKLAQRLKEEE